jgi:hypothetical protein
MVAATVRRATESAESAEQRFVLHHVPWSAHVVLRDALDDADNVGVRMTYLEGSLELLSPSALCKVEPSSVAHSIERQRMADYPKQATESPLRLVTPSVPTATQPGDFPGARPTHRIVRTGSNLSERC